MEEELLTIVIVLFLGITSKVLQQVIAVEEVCKIHPAPLSYRFVAQLFLVCFAKRCAQCY